MYVYYNPLDLNCKSITGAVPEDTKITFTVKTDLPEVSLLIRNDKDVGIKEYPLINDGGGNFSITLEGLSCGLYFYSFSLKEHGFVGIGDDYNGTITYDPKYYQLTVYSKDYATPDWVKGGIIYQIFPDRFCKKGDYPIEDGKILRTDWGATPYYKPWNGTVFNNDFFGGNFKGIESKLSYLKDLGVSIIYLNPIFKAYSNHRYDTGDYMQLDPLLGSEEDFKSLINSAKGLGINIVLDGVFNHTGSDSLYFNKYGRYNSLGAFQSKTSPYYSWYNFVHYPEQYEAWWGIDTLPAINEHNPEYIQFITGENGVLRHYLKMGIKGWRLDVADELPIAFTDKIREAVKAEDKDAYLIGEVWEDATNKIAYSERRPYFQGKQLDSVMNYPLKEAIINFSLNNNARALSYAIKEQIDHYPKCALDVLMNMLGTHDTCRILTVLGDENPYRTNEDAEFYRLDSEHYCLGIERLKTASILQYTLYGVPSLYYGDEAGMEGYKDPFNRRGYPWDYENKDLINWFKRLGEIRRKIDVFKDGEYKEIFVDDNILVYERTKGDKTVVVAINRSNYDYNLNYKGTLYNLIDGTSSKKIFTVKAHTSGVFYDKKI